MSIGQRIAKKRKELGLSQEALGEQVGVSRQSISKWESDAAMPEIEKLVVMSRLFSVSVGWLLGVEEARESVSPEPPEELTVQQLKMVEEIVERYLAARPGGLSRRRRRCLKLAVAAAAVCFSVGLFRLSAKLDRLDQQYQNLQNSVGNVSSSVNHQIGNIAGRVEEVLKAQNHLTADYSVEWLERDLSAGTVNAFARAVPKTYRPGMTAVFLAECGGEVLEFPGEPGDNGIFSAGMTLPLRDVINVSVVFVDGDTRETQLLESATGLYSRSIPEGYAEDTWQFEEAAWSDGVLHLSAGETFVREIWKNDVREASGDGADAGPADVSEVQVGLFKNGEMVCMLSAIPKPDTYHGFEDCLFFAYGEQHFPFEKGDILCLAAVVTDACGRTTVRGGAEWELAEPEENGEAWHLEENGNNGYYRYDAPADWGL